MEMLNPMENLMKLESGDECGEELASYRRLSRARKKLVCFNKRMLRF